MIYGDNTVPGISIVLPVYNTEKYLHQCLKSILSQGYSDFELICIDDGSTDDSLNILNDFARKDTRISVYHRKHEGVSAARNYGIQFVKGKYLLLLDSDDFFEASMLERIYNDAEKYSAQVVAFGFYKYDDATGAIYSDIREKRTFLTSASGLGKELFLKFQPNMWCKLFLTSFVLQSGIKFQSIPAWADVYFSWMMLLLADRIVVSKDKPVYYRVNNSGSIQGNPQKPLECVALAYEELKREMKNRDLFYGSFKESYYARAWRSMLHLLLSSKADENSRERLYYYIKKKSIPNIFDSMEDIADPLFKPIFESATLTDYLLKCIHLFQTDYVPKNCKDYQLGNMLLRLPRRFLSR